MIRKLLIIVCLISTVYIAFAEKKKKKGKDKVQKTEAVADSAIDYRLPGAPLPPVNFFLKNGRYVTNEDLDNGANLFIMMFNPTCEHCQDQAQQLEKNIALLKKSIFIMIAAPQMKEYLSYFENGTHVSQYPSIKVGLDSSKYIEKTFSYQALPQINVYDANRKLLRVFVGETSMDTLKQYLQ
jgi:hypothetical protein